MSDEKATVLLTAEEVFLLKLKSETAELHTKLESSPLSRKLFSPQITLSDYQLYLAAMREVLDWYESHIFPEVSAVITDVGDRTKLRAIDKDLSALNATMLKKPAFEVPVIQAEALGFMYVIEGSTLGGMMILKQLQGQPFISDTTTNFFQVYGRNTGIYWRNFIKVLSIHAVENHVENEVIEGAKKAFRQIDRYFISMGQG